MANNQQYIELHGKIKRVLRNDPYKTVVLFDELDKGSLALTIPKMNMLYRELKLHKYYNLFAELKGVSVVTDGKMYTNNTLIVRKTISS